MKKMILAVIGGMMLTATPAMAEHKLLVTDVLDPLQVEAQAKFEYSNTSFEYKVPYFGSRAVERRVEAVESQYSVGVGLGHGIEVTASIPYLIKEWAHTESSFTRNGGAEEDASGFGDFAVQAKFRVLGGEKDRVTVVSGVGVKFDSGSDEVGTHTTDVSPFIAGSVNLPNHHTPYAIYRATIRNHEAPDTHTVSVGLEKEFNHVVTLDAKIDSNFNTATSYTKAFEDFSFELTSYIQVAHNFYLLPTASYVVSTDAKSKDVPVRGSFDGFRGGLSLYYLF